MKSITYLILATAMLGSFCNFACGASSLSKTAVIEHIQSRINSGPGKHCDSVVLTNSSSDGYTGYIKWEDGGITALDAKVFGNDIQYSFGNAIQPATKTYIDNHSHTLLSQKPTLTSPEDKFERSTPLFLLCVYVISGIVLPVGVVWGIRKFWKYIEYKYNYNIFDVKNICLVGIALGVWLVPLLIIWFHCRVFGKTPEGTASWLPWAGCGLISVILLISMFIRTAKATPLGMAIIIFFVQVVVITLGISVFVIIGIIAILAILGAKYNRMMDNDRKRYPWRYI